MSSSLRKPHYVSIESESSLCLDLSLGGLFSKVRSVCSDEWKASFSSDDLVATSCCDAEEKASPAHADWACSLDNDNNMQSQKLRRDLVSRRRRGFDQLGGIIQRKRIRESDDSSCCFTDQYIPSSACNLAAAGPHLCSTPCSLAPTSTGHCPSTSSHILTPTLASRLPSSIIQGPQLLTSGSNGLPINDMLPNRIRGTIREEEEGRSTSSSSIEMERGDKLDDQTITQQKVTEVEAPRSRCGSNSDIIGSMGVDSAAIPNSTSSMKLHTHPPLATPNSAQTQLSMPLQWCYALPQYALHYPFHTITRPRTSEQDKIVSPLCPIFAAPSDDHQLPQKNCSSLSLTTVTVPASVRSPRRAAVRGKLPDNQAISYIEDGASTSRLPIWGNGALEKNASLQKPNPQAGKDMLSPTAIDSTTLNEIVPCGSTVSDVWTSGAPSAPRLLFSTSQSANYPNEVCAHPILQPFSSSTSSAIIDLKVHMDKQELGPVKEAACSPSWLTPRTSTNLSPAAGMSSGQWISRNPGDRSKASKSCQQESDDIVSSHLRGPISQHSEIVKSVSGRKPSKSVQFSSDVREAVKHGSNHSNQDQLHAASPSRRAQRGKSCKSLSVENTVLEKQYMFNGCARGHSRGGIAKDNQLHEHFEDDGSAMNTSSEQSEQCQGTESPALMIPEAGSHGKLIGGGDLPRVSTTSGGPNGRTVYGVMYITKSKQACLICSCHGTHMSPSEFVQHSGSTDLSNPERRIVVTGFSMYCEARSRPSVAPN